ncbi:MAG: superoxide dismutase family protein [Acidimicrobiales bacterium]
MKRSLIVAVPVAALTIGATMGGASGGATATAVLRDANGAEMGTVKVVTSGNSAQVIAYVHAPAAAAGFHGFHIHSRGLCDPNAVDPATNLVVPFYSAGGHLGGTAGQTHPGHDGDMPSLLVNKNGSAQLRFKTDRVDLAKILDADGSAVIVHAGPDNFANIPARYSATGPDTATLNTGDSGGRSYCGMFQ